MTVEWPNFVFVKVDFFFVSLICVFLPFDTIRIVKWQCDWDTIRNNEIKCYLISTMFLKWNEYITYVWKNKIQFINIYLLTTAACVFNSLYEIMLWTEAICTACVLWKAIIKSAYSTPFSAHNVTWHVHLKKKKHKKIYMFKWYLSESDLVSEYDLFIQNIYYLLYINSCYGGQK